MALSTVLTSHSPQHEDVNPGNTMMELNSFLFLFPVCEKTENHALFYFGDWKEETSCTDKNSQAGHQWLTPVISSYSRQRVRGLQFKASPGK
jgi:hypothetical protein